MTVAIVSVGYDGTVDETQWAHLMGKAGSSEYGVDLAGDFGVNPVAGQDRTVRVAPGKAWGHGVLDVMDVEQTLQFALPASGDRYDMIVLRRDWQPPGGATTLAIVQGSASSATLPARKTGTLGILDDQPLALVRVSAGSTSVSVTADLRVWARNGGASAKHTHALQYLGALGALVEIAGDLWQRRVGSAGAEWVKAISAAGSEDSGWVKGDRNGTGWTGGDPDFIESRKVGDLVEVRLRLRRNGADIPVPANGDIADVHVGRLTAAHAPGAGRWHALASGPSGRLSAIYVDHDGNLYLAALAPGSTFTSGSHVSASGMFRIG